MIWLCYWYWVISFGHADLYKLLNEEYNRKIGVNCQILKRVIELENRVWVLSEIEEQRIRHEPQRRNSI